MKDIENTKDIELLVSGFYTEVLKDDTIGYIFTDVAHVDWDTHLTKMYRFWETILLDKMTFKGNPMDVHIQLSKRTPIEDVHFNQWFYLWETIIDKNFKGAVAENAKLRGKNIANLMCYKINQNQN